MENLQRSQFVIARILQHLMENGITISTLKFEYLGLERVYEQFFESCFDWLCDEGFVRYKSISRYKNAPATITDPVLTAKGFEFLGQPLEVDGKEFSVADRVTQIAKEDKSFSKVGDLVGGILGGFTKSIGS